MRAHRLTDYLYELSEKFNKFYVQCKVRNQIIPILWTSAAPAGAWPPAGPRRPARRAPPPSPQKEGHPGPRAHLTLAPQPEPVQVIGGENEDSRLLLAEATARVMRQCFSLLGITPLYRI